MDRRAFLSGTMAGAALALAPALARADAVRITLADLRGSLPPPDPAPVAGAPDEQSAALQAAIDRAGRDGRPLFLPPGRYAVSNLRLPERLSLIGVPGETRLIYTGGGALMTASGCRQLCIDGIVFDGANRSLADDEGGLVTFDAVGELLLTRTEILGSAGDGLALSRVAGRLSGSTITGARRLGLKSTNAAGLAIADNLVAGCGDGGILVRRWESGDDGTQVTGNRIERIRALSGEGHGDGLAVIAAGGVAVDGNRIVGCARSAIRAAAASRIRIAGNHGLDAGATAIVLDGATEGAVVDGNLVDGAAAGIVVGGGDGSLTAISGNLARNLAGAPEDDRPAGIGIAADRDAVLTGNAVEGAEAIGIRLGWGPALANIVASANMVRRAGIGIGVSVVGDAGGAVITANMISGARHGAICGMRWGEIVAGDLLARAAAYPGLVLERNVVG